MLTKQEILLGKGPRVESSRAREPRRTALSRGFAVPGYMVLGLVSRLSLANHSESESFLVVQVVVYLVQPRWMPVRRILGGGWTCSISF